MDGGLGKTVITLTAVWELLFDYFDVRKVLVVAPLRVARDTWGGELEKWEHLSGIGMSKVLGPEKERLAGQRLGRFIGGYRERFFLPDKRSRQMVFSYKPRDGAEEAIYGLISDICISMRACDYLDMPECVYNRVEVSMSGREAELYVRLERDMLLPFADGDIDAVNAAGLSNKLLQMANGAVYDENGRVKRIHDRKLEALDERVMAALERKDCGQAALVDAVRARIGGGKDGDREAV